MQASPCRPRRSPQAEWRTRQAACITWKRLATSHSGLAARSSETWDALTRGEFPCSRMEFGHASPDRKPAGRFSMRSHGMSPFRRLKSAL